MEYDKNDRMLEILIRCLRGERISPKKLADEYEVSTKSGSRISAGSVISCISSRDGYSVGTS